MNLPLVISILGWIGAALVLLAYGLVSIQWLKGNSIGYQALNVAGAIFLIINSYSAGAYPSVGVNVVWVGIAAYTLLYARNNETEITIKKTTSQTSKRIRLQKITIEHIKMRAFKQTIRKS